MAACSVQRDHPEDLVSTFGEDDHPVLVADLSETP